MASANVVEFTDANFDAEVLASKVPVLVDFGAEWCGPCRAMLPHVEAVADALAGKAKIGKVDIDANRGISMRFNISTIPTILIFKDGQKVKTFVGIKKKEELASALADFGAV
jgi:thioredoxin 1